MVVVSYYDSMELEPSDDFFIGSSGWTEWLKEDSDWELVIEEWELQNSI